MFEPLFGFTATDCTGLSSPTYKPTNYFLMKQKTVQKPQLARAQGTTKKADAFGLLSQFLPS
jgi:hypothetical protein